MTNDASRTSKQGAFQPATPENRSLEEGRRSWRWAVPAAIFLLGFALRLFRIGHQGVDDDEAFSLITTRLPFADMIRQLVKDFVHPPLHYLLLRGWFKLFGFGLLQARLLSAVFDALAVLILYFLARYLFGRRTALVSSLLLAVSQLAIASAQEARPYAQLDFFALLSTYLFVRALREKRAPYWYGFVGSSIAMMYTHYFGMFVIAALALWAAINRERYRPRLGWIVAGAALGLVLYMPWLASGVMGVAASSPKTFSGTHDVFATHWFTPFTMVNVFNNGRVRGVSTPAPSAPWWAFVIGGLLFTAPAALAVRKWLAASISRETVNESDREALALAAILWLLPSLAIIGLGLAVHIQYQVRYVLFCAAPYYILVALGMSEVRSNALRWASVLLILAYSANSLRAVYFMEWKGQFLGGFRGAYGHIETNRQEGDCGFIQSYLRAPGFYKVPPPSIEAIPLQRLSAGALGCRRIWVVGGLGGVDRSSLERVYAKSEEKNYYGLPVALYSIK